MVKNFLLSVTYIHTILHTKTFFNVRRSFENNYDNEKLNKIASFINSMVIIQYNQTFC